MRVAGQSSRRRQTDEHAWHSDFGTRRPETQEMPRTAILRSKATRNAADIKLGPTIPVSRVIWISINTKPTV
jgi:hypothetical protein